MRSERISGLLALSLAVVLGMCAVGLKGRGRELYEKVVTDEDRYYLPPSNWLRAFSMGYNEATSDILWATTMVYFGGKKHWTKPSDPNYESQIPRYTVNYLELVTSLDPRFVGAYRDGGRLTLYHMGRITKDTVQMAIELLEKGMENFPDDGDIAFNLGFMHYYEMDPFLPKDEDDPLRRHHKEKGARLLRLASTMEGVPRYSSLLAGTLLKREGMKELVVEHLKAMLVKETDPAVRKSLEGQLYQALGEASLRDIQATAELQERWRDELPYAPFDLFLMVQPGAEIDHRELVQPTFYEDRLLGIRDDE